jgi:hypothetical protein
MPADEKARQLFLLRPLQNLDNGVQAQMRRMTSVFSIVR